MLLEINPPPPLFASHKRTRLLTPIVLEVIVEATTIEQVFEKFLEVGVVRRLLKFEIPCVVHEGKKLLRQVFCECVKLYPQFFVPNLLILFFFGASWDSLPGQSTF